MKMSLQIRRSRKHGNNVACSIDGQLLMSNLENVLSKTNSAMGHVHLIKVRIILFQH